MAGRRPCIHLLDVRTDEERAICTLPAAIHIPMNLIPLRQNELPDDDLPIVAYCHHGIRSLHTAMYLEDAGFEISTTCKAVLMLGQCRLTVK